MNQAFNEDNKPRRLLKAFHAFKSDPTDDNFNRITKAVNASDGCVCVKNKVQNFAQSLVGRSQYEGFVTNFKQLFDQ